MNTFCEIKADRVRDAQRADLEVGEVDLIRTSFHGKYWGSIKITTHVDHISHCRIASGKNWWNRWTYRLFITNTRSDANRVRANLEVSEVELRASRLDHSATRERRLRLATQDCCSRKATMEREPVVSRTDHTMRIPSGVASQATTNHAAKGWPVFVNLRNTGNL